jgi:hypothetical protein
MFLHIEVPKAETMSTDPSNGLRWSTASFGHNAGAPRRWLGMPNFCRDNSPTGGAVLSYKR